jgi:hypothetical protein
VLPTGTDHPDTDAGVTFPDMAWTSFDRYARYGAIVRALRANLGPGRHRVLDVGDCAGHLRAFDPELSVIGLDLSPAAERLAGAIPVHGDGTHLPFPDDAFTAVVSSDVLEHVPPAGRPAFLAELRRVSSDLVVVAAPFDTPGVAGVEELVRRYALLALGTPQPQLEEHHANGLPRVEYTVAALAVGGAEVAVAGNGNLWDWLTFMLLRFQLEARPPLAPLSAGYDLLYNTTLAGRSDIGPHYRQLVVARRGGPAGTGVPQPAPAPEPFSPALLAALIGADSTEVTRQDTVPRLDGLIHEVRETHMQTDRLEYALGRANAEIAELRARVDELLAVQHRLVRPLSAVADRTRRLRAAVRALLR